MYRSAIEYLVKWKLKARRKPLVIRGARQVGKSYLVSMFAEQTIKVYEKALLPKTAQSTVG